ncbi:hypothetical protein EV140_1567 [Microcella alkaliphila]|uniref:YtxH domain-containing protein n=1 Tax=Microcella alkaliphila TaxID=279828 RepID=A0A4Q7TI70_9MICO|nr:hypothetical protein [Microcella alkaliphila]RZT59587.1 hypothetical protein EV140_1567 [Microcella alkaliphila]
MNRNVLIVGGAAITAYILGTRANRPTLAEHPETLRHQVERLWTDPQAKKRRAKFRKQRAKDARAATKALQKQTAKARKTLGKQAESARKNVAKQTDRATKKVRSAIAA